MKLTKWIKLNRIFWGVCPHCGGPLEVTYQDPKKPLPWFKANCNDLVHCERCKNAGLVWVSTNKENIGIYWPENIGASLLFDTYKNKYNLNT